MKTLMLLFTLITLTSSLFAFNVNKSLLSLHATLLPKIYLMDYNFKEKTKEKSINIALVYERDEYKSAQLLKTLMLEKYKDGIHSYKLSIELVRYRNIASRHANVYYLFPSKKENIERVVRSAAKDKALTFAYSQKALKYGVMISLDVSKRTKPLLNLQAIKEHHISIRPILIDISSIYNLQTKTYYNTIKIDNFVYYLA